LLFTTRHEQKQVIIHYKSHTPYYTLLGLLQYGLAKLDLR